MSVCHAKNMVKHGEKDMFGYSFDQ
jgi:hypothetical protein